MAKIIGLGNALVDVLATLEDENILRKLELPKGSMTFVDEEKLQTINTLFATLETKQVTGGSAGNSIRALAHLGTSVGFVGKVGTDEAGSFYGTGLENCGVTSHLLASPTHPSGIACTFITPDGERTFADHLGAAATLCADDLNPTMFEGYTHLLLEGYLVQNHDLMLRAVELAHKAGLQICMDMASYNVVREEHDFFSHFITNHIDILFANEEEARAMTNKEPREALEELARLCRIVVVKVGAKGALIARGDERAEVEAVPVKRVTDTTGAGDFFAAGFLHALLQGRPLEECGRMGALLASKVIQVVGTELPEREWQELTNQNQA